MKVKKFLTSIEYISKIFLLSPHGSCSSPSWKDLRFSNAVVLSGFIFYFCFHLTYVTNHDYAGTRVKLVTFFIDNYNKYSGLLLVTVLVLLQYYHQSKTAEINKIFIHVDNIFAKRLKIKIRSVKSMR